MTNQEHHEFIVSILTKLVPVLDCEELDALSRCCGIRVDEFYGGDCSEYQYRTPRPVEEYQTPF